MNAVQHFANHFPDKGHEESLEHLTLPRIEMTRGENRDVWKTQTYADFAQKLKRKNLDTLLTKDIADAAFRMAAMRMVDPRKGRDSAIVRVRHKALGDVASALLINECSVWARSLLSTGKVDDASSSRYGSRTSVPSKILRVRCALTCRVCGSSRSTSIATPLETYLAGTFGNSVGIGWLARVFQRLVMLRWYHVNGKLK
jgi:hypothetical protein